ncbi:MAG: alkyl hydroperoxide reductase AhpD [Phycisphaerales bacterium]|nr:MAG: alkyl hydroperoxide reductase AhpD [Phycisphaerales bacterium]
MARLRVIDPDSTSGPVREIFDGPLKGKHLNIFKGMANAPAALSAYLGMAKALGEGVLTPAEREVVALVTGQHTGCDYCLAAHTHLAKQAGLSESQTLQARRGEMDDPRLDALARFTKAVLETNGSVDDAELDAFRKAGYTDQHVAEVVAAIGLNLYTNLFNHVNQTELDLPKAPALEPAPSA